MNKNVLMLLVFAAMMFAQCSPKTTDAAMKDKDKAMDKVATTAKSAQDAAKSWRGKVPTAGPARKVELGTYSSFDLPNGLKVIVVENHKIPRVSYQISLNNDALVEGDMAGYVSMAGDLMSKGTTNRTKAQIDESIDFIGASLNTSSGGIFGSSLTKHQDKLLEVMADVLYNPVFPQEEFNKLKTQTLTGLASSKSDPNSMAGNVANIVNYGAGHPYGEVSTEETVNNITLDKVKSYYNTYFKPNNAFLIVVGDITPDDAMMKARKYFGNWKSGDIMMPKYSKPAMPTGTNVHFANKDGAVQSVIRVTYPIDYTPGNPDAIKARVMNNILGGGVFSGRLMQNLREDKAYTYGARSSLSSDPLIGNFNAFASVRNEVTDSSVHEFLYEMRKMTTDGVDAADLELAKNSMAGGFARSLESPQTIARFARNTYKYNLPADYYSTYLSRLAAVSEADFREMAKKYIRPENANIIVVGSKDDVAEKLKRFDSDGVIDYYDAFGNKLKNTNKALAANVTAEQVISDYIAAIGGESKLRAVNTMHTLMKMSVMGQDATNEMWQKGNNKMKMTMAMGGNVMQETIYDGTKAVVSSMGQSQSITDPAQLAGIKDQALMFAQLDYATTMDLELKGMEEVNGEQAYKIKVTNKATGDKHTEYYSAKTNYLVKTVATQGEGEQVQTITSEISDYKAVDGIMIPYKVSLIGAAPFPLNMEATDIKVNTNIPDATFMVK